jgi:DNA polymerase III alpha subunit
MPDIDIDFLNREQALDLFEHIQSSRVDNGKLVKHNTGVYLHPVPINAETGLSAVPYNEADSRGYFKVDFLNVGIYKGVRDETHLIELMNRAPLWDLLEQDDFSDLLFHINGHGEILRQMKPRCVQELAAVLAMIRPAKRHLIGKDWKTVMSEVWVKPENEDYFFKKSHATAYAVAIVVQMNLICEGVSGEYR